MFARRALLVGVCSLFLMAGHSAPPAAKLSKPDYAGGQCDDPALTPSQRAGCQIWFYATAGNARFHTYVFQQRMGILIDWFRVLNADERKDRFKAWGMINDPGCCTPGSPNCPAKSKEETYGFDYCKGDEVLLKYVGKPGYRDPACDGQGFQEAPVAAGQKDQRQSPCDLEFGTSTGAMGLRKFPNPRFNPDRWKELNGSLGTWKGYNGKLADGSGQKRLLDGSVEPPFLVGMSCGACHISFDPLNPPRDPANPTMANIKGAVGNQYNRMSEVMASGMPTNSFAWQVFAHSRPGTVDTSAVPTDGINNAGTMNAIINFDKRPTFPNEKVTKWRPVTSCAAASDTCWCEPGRDGKCWQKSLQIETVHHILKGGEDSIGVLGAIQRVYFNIGSCSETCWLNHLTAQKEIDPYQRNFGQTPFDIGQCRRDCPNFRAIEDRVQNIADFLLSQRPYDLYKARGLASRHDLVEQLDKEYGAGSVARGRQVFADNCARCHSSQTDAMGTRDFYKTDANGVREDWMGNDDSTPVGEVGTFRSRALHSNHMAGHVWEQFGSETLRERKTDLNLPDVSDGGRGYYRNISLLSVWAFAPFLHNNSIGPEICGKPAGSSNDFYESPYVDANLQPVKNPPACWAFDPSVKGRYDLFKASVDELLNPQKRIPKVKLLNEDIPIEVGFRLWDFQNKKLGGKVGLKIVVAKGLPSATVGNLLYKQFADDLVLAYTDNALLKSNLRARLKERLPEGKDPSQQEVDAAAAEVKTLAGQVFADPTRALTITQKHSPLIEKFYMSSTALIENDGHRFGEDLPDRDKKALTAFLATL